MRRKRKKRRKLVESAVTAAVQELGGVLQTAVVAKVVPETVYRAMREGRFVSAKAVLRIAIALHPDDPEAQMARATKLAGVPN
jgi:Flp pilus assembly protein TadD